VLNVSCKPDPVLGVVVARSRVRGPFERRRDMAPKNAVAGSDPFMLHLKEELKLARKLLPELLKTQDEGERKVVELVGQEFEEIFKILYQN
jgi:hypothetical protein